MIYGTGPELSVPITYAPTLALKVNPLWAEVNRFCSLLFYALATIGILSILNRQNINSSRFRLAFCAVSLTGIVFIEFFLVKTEVLISRWFIFMQILLAIPAAIGLFLIFNTMRTHWKGLMITAGIIAGLTFLMISNTTASFDSPVFPAYLKDKSALTESELRAANTLNSLYTGNLVMDNTHALALVDKPERLVKHISYEDEQDGFSKVNGLLILRKYITDNVFYARTKEGTTYQTEFEYDPYQALESNGFNHIYESGTVGAYSR
jgi:hypothetical protein